MAPSKRVGTSLAHCSWGGLSARAEQTITPGEFPNGTGPVIAYGNGRSYGDSCLLSDGLLIRTRAEDAVESFDPQTGLLIADAGALLADVLKLTVPQGWFAPVVPGTRFVTMGGALANDVHGKNHHVAGTFGQHVPWFDLVRSDGSTRRCSATENIDLYRATIGGLGLTGLITRLAIQFVPIAGPFMRQDVVPFANIDGFFEQAAGADSSHAYTVAWIDQLAKGPSLGRGVFFRANHHDASADAWVPSRPLPLLPFTPPIPLINGLSMRLFNSLYSALNREKHDQQVRLEPFFWPLDRINGWNRAYGRRGLRQFQCVVPMAPARDAVRDLLQAAGRAGEASFLTVLKLFGNTPSPGMMSFPMPGATLTLDFAYRGTRTDRLLADLDTITLQAGGRVNPYKDARMSPATFAASFPQWQEFARHTDPAFTSNFWRRVTAS